MNNIRPHQPVMITEVLELLAIKPDGIYLDGTVGGGGHAREIASRLKNGLLIGLDCDPNALGGARAHLQGFLNCVKLVRANFAQLDKVLDELGIRSVNGILLDLGVSLTQLDTPERGLSFRLKGPLDMRLDPTRELTAADLVNSLGERELTEIFRGYGEERWAARIARNIVRARCAAPIETTSDLVEIIERSIPAAVRYKSRIHPATRVFQALRIVVNNELENLQKALAVGCERLAPGGHFVVISFHSLEDRIVKRFFRAQLKAGRAEHIWGPLRPAPEERARNPRARSAKLRALSKAP